MPRAKLKTRKEPQYFHVMDDIALKIRDGIYRPGMKLESVRELSKKYKLARGVVLYALNLLSCKAYLYSEPKRGYFVSPNLKPRRSYTIGYFISNYDLMQMGEGIAIVRKKALEYGYRVIPGFNYYDGSTLGDFLRKNPVLDGIAIDGIVDEKLLDELKEFHRPYMVIGNHNISSKHPQTRSDIKKNFYDATINVFRRFKGKRVAAIMGDVHYAADQETMEALKEALQDAGTAKCPDLIASSVESDGFGHCCRILKNNVPDVLFLMSSQMGGYRKYVNIFRPGKRPHVIYTSSILEPGDEAIFDEFLNLNCGYDYTARAIDNLFERIDEQSMNEVPKRTVKENNP